MNDYEKAEFIKTIKRMSLQVEEEEFVLKWNENRHQTLENSETGWRDVQADRTLMEMMKKRDLDFSRANVEFSRASLAIAKYCKNKLEEE